jgi:hypothetical protein
MFGLKADIKDADVGGVIWRAHGDFAFGWATTFSEWLIFCSYIPFKSMVNATLTIHDSKPRFILSGGSYCKARADDIPGDMKGSALVEFSCDKSVLALANTA